MSRIRVLEGILAVLLLAGAGFLRGARPDPGDQPTVGFITPLTGPRASIGEDARAAAELALEELRSEVPPIPAFSLRFEDSQGDPAKGVAAFHSLAGAGAAAVITQNSNISLPIAPIANRLGIVQLAITTTSDRFTTPRDFIFRTNGNTSGEARLMGEILGADAAPAGIVTMLDEYPEMLRGHLIEELARRGVPLVLDERFNPAEQDYRTFTARLSRAGAHAVICLGYQTQCGLFVKQISEGGLRPGLILVNTPVNNREFFTVAGAASEGVLATYPAPDPGHPAAKSFRERTGREMNFFSSNAYDAVKILGMAVRRCGGGATARCLAESLNMTGEIGGASGRKRFDGNGDMEDSYLVMIARGGKFEPLSPGPSAAGNS